MKIINETVETLKEKAREGYETVKEVVTSDRETLNDIYNAVKMGTIENIKSIVDDEGIDINATDMDGNTLLHISARSNPSIEVLQYLVSRGAKIDVRNKEGNCPLHFASQYNHDVEYLISAGADVNATNNDGDTPLHLASKDNQNVTVLKSLISKISEINKKNRYGNTPLHLASSDNDNIEIIDCLISHEAKIHEINNDGETPLHRAARSNSNIEIIEYLISKGAKVNATEKCGWTPLHLASNSNDNMEVLELLINEKADVKASSRDGWAPLHLAVFYVSENPSQIERLKFLIKKGADPDAKTIWGITPQDLIEKFGIKFSSGGCYIATAVYGAYDAPEVLVLRKYRDEVLSKSLAGRIFISAYYMISPALASKLRHTKKINESIKCILNCLIKKILGVKNEYISS
jgi:ankyrin repeat protein